jgi:hypothetical protein
MDEHQKAVQLGDEIKKIASNPSFQQAITQMVDRQMQIIKSSQVEESSKRESAFFLLRAIQELQNEFNVLVNRRDRAQLEIEKNSKTETKTRAARK